MSHTHAGAIQVAKAAASVVAAQDFNGAVVNVYDTPTAQIKWHDDGEYWYKCRHMYTRMCMWAVHGGQVMEANHRPGGGG